MAGDPTPQRSRAMMLSGLTAALGVAALLSGFLIFMGPIFLFGTLLFYLRARHIEIVRQQCPSCHSTNEIETGVNRYRCPYCRQYVRRENGYWQIETQSTTRP